MQYGMDTPSFLSCGNTTIGMFVTAAFLCHGNGFAKAKKEKECIK